MNRKDAWPMVRLGDIQRKTSSINPTKLPDQKFALFSIPSYESGYPEIRLGQEILSNKTHLMPRDVLLSKIVPHTRRSWIVGEHPIPTIGSSEWIVFHDDRFDPRFIRNFLMSDSFHVQYLQTVAGVGGSLNRARPTAVAQIKIPLPPLAEQRRIAEILDNSATTIKARQIQIEMLTRLEQSLFEKYSAEHMSRSIQLRFQDAVPRIEGGKSPKCGNRPAMDNEWGVLKLSAVTSGEFKEDENKVYSENVESLAHLEIKPGDLLMTRKNTVDLVGAVSLVGGTRSQLLLPDLIFRLVVDQEIVKTRYLAALLMSPPMRSSVRRLAGGSAKSMSNISKQRLNQLILHIPPLETQQEFIEKSIEIQRLKEQARRTCALEKELQHSLSVRAFAGEL